MQLTKEEIQQIADLARIELTEDEIIQRQKDLSNVLGYFEKLSELNTDDVEEIGHITGMKDIFRNDFINEATDTEKKCIMDNVLKENDGYIQVKTIL